MTNDLVQKLTDHAGLIRKMDAIANAGGTIQTNEATAALLDKAARVITLYRARYPDHPANGEQGRQEPDR